MEMSKTNYAVKPCLPVFLQVVLEQYGQSMQATINDTMSGY